MGALFPEQFLILGVHARNRALAQLEQEKGEVMREALRLQMMEFGRTPKQLFTKPHSKRRVAVTGGPLLNPFCGGCLGSSGSAAPSVRPTNVLHPTFVQVSSPFLPPDQPRCTLERPSARACRSMP